MEHYTMPNHPAEACSDKWNLFYFAFWQWKDKKLPFFKSIQSWRNKWLRDLFARVLCYQSAYIHSTTLRITINLQCGGFNPPDINDRYCISLAFKYLLLAMFFLTTRSRTYRYTNELYYNIILKWLNPRIVAEFRSAVKVNEWIDIREISFLCYHHS